MKHIVCKLTLKPFLCPGSNFYTFYYQTELYLVLVIYTDNYDFSVNRHKLLVQLNDHLFH